MIRASFHPNAYLSHVKNVNRGLAARTKILNVLERASGDGKTVGAQAGLSYGVAMHHLKLLAKDGIVDHRGHRPCTWSLTGKGQKRLLGSS